MSSRIEPKAALKCLFDVKLSVITGGINQRFTPALRHDTRTSCCQSLLSGGRTGWRRCFSHLTHFLGILPGVTSHLRTNHIHPFHCRQKDQPSQRKSVFQWKDYLVLRAVCGHSAHVSTYIHFFLNSSDNLRRFVMQGFVKCLWQWQGSERHSGWSSVKRSVLWSVPHRPRAWCLCWRTASAEENCWTVLMCFYCTVDKSNCLNWRHNWRQTLQPWRPGTRNV